MEGGFSRMDPKLLDLIPKDNEWVVKKEMIEIPRNHHGSPSQENSLELRLGPPTSVEQDGAKNKSRVTDQGGVGHFAHPNFGHKGWAMNNNNNNNGGHSATHAAGFLQFHSNPQRLTVTGKESSQPCNTQGPAEKKPFSPTSAKTAVPNNNTSQKRTAPAPVVGWPPVRSFRKNLATSSLGKQSSESQNVVANKVSGEEKPLVDSCRKGLFVKINMDGVPIGRKVDLKAFDSYEKLSSAVDELFRGLLAAQRDFSAAGFKNNNVEEKAITGLLDGKGEYTLVYEDNEGDRMLVGDVPWHMFVSTVKRLRVLKSSELSTLCLAAKQEKVSEEVR